MSINPNPGLAGYTELRQDLIHLADEFNKKRLELIEIQKTISATVLELVLAADKLTPKTLGERDGDGALRKDFKTDTDVQAVADHLMPSRRSCGLCEKPGHRRDNCPDADKILATKKETSKVKAERTERKAALQGTGKRACSNCRKPGHRAKNCPEPVLTKKKGK